MLPDNPLHVIRELAQNWHLANPELYEGPLPVGDARRLESLGVIDRATLPQKAGWQRSEIKLWIPCKPAGPHDAESGRSNQIEEGDFSRLLTCKAGAMHHHKSHRHRNGQHQ